MILESAQGLNPSFFLLWGSTWGSIGSISNFFYDALCMKD